jgi:hypothetical protein
MSGSRDDDAENEGSGREQDTGLAANPVDEDTEE